MSKKNIDYKIFFSVLAMIIFGMIMVSSVSVYPSFKRTSELVAAGLMQEPNNYYYVIRNIISIIASLSVFVIIVKIDYKFFEKFAKWFYLLSIVSLTFVLIKGLALKGARGWFSIPGIPFTIQPAEFSKIALIIFLAFFFKKYQGYLRNVQKGFLPFLGIIGIPIVLIGLQPDFGSLLIMIPVSVIMFYFAGANIKHLLGILVIGLVGIAGLYVAGDYDKETMKSTNTLGYVTRRIDQFLFSGGDTGELQYQTQQGLIAIGSGGLNGKGFGQSIQKFGHLPEVQGDFIFSVIIEELGFFGGLWLISLYLFVGYRGFLIANNVADPFAKYTAIGITSRFMFQTFINIGVNLNIIPNTGVTLPFISYGGSSLLSLMIALGILLSISRYADYKPKYSRLENKKLLF